MSAVVVSAAMQKGGVGKTTSTANLAGAASALGYRTLVLDLDPQGNTTTTLANAKIARDQETIADALHPSEADRVALADVIVPTIWDNVFLAPAVTNTLTTVERLIDTAIMDREYRLAEALEPVLPDFDLVLVDNAPALGQLLQNALTVSHFVYTPCQADEWSCDGLAELRLTIRRVQKRLNPDLVWSGVLISMWRDTGDENFWLGEIIDQLDRSEAWGGLEVWSKDMIPLWVAIKTTLASGRRLDLAKEARLRNLAHTYRRILARWITDPEVTI